MTAPIATIDDRFEVYRIVTDMESLHEAFVERVEDLQVTRVAIDEAGELTPGYSSKLLCTPPMKTIGKESLPKMLKATGMALVLVIDDERFAPLKATMAKRKKVMRTQVRIKRVKGYFTKENAGEIRKKGWASVPPEMRKKLMRKVAKARWRKRHKAGASLISANTPSCADVQSAANT